MPIAYIIWHFGTPYAEYHNQNYLAEFSIMGLAQKNIFSIMAITNCKEHSKEKHDGKR